MVWFSEASYRFMTKREVVDARIAWDKIAANCFTDYLNKHKKKEKGDHVSYKELFEHTHQRKNTGDFLSQKAKEVMVRLHSSSLRGGLRRRARSSRCL
ncbi:hypothetical protein Taro_038157 [Colocasia esculenta]|uniref:Uncharacterized protein n=1 Tax=Colocasia esculenta TaxID=4460 RepID=A0A843WRV3_COLES|nr:hypothetical protein [Colocasia esculenta]